MERTAIAIVLILGLSFLATIDCPVVEVQAQDYYDRYEPTMTPPSILVTSPQNHSIINTNSIYLAFNVSEPQVIEISPDATKHSSRLIRFSYKGDWQTEEQSQYLPPYESIDFLEFNTTISGIPEGTHELQITAVGEVGIEVGFMGFSYYPDANASIIFTVSPELELFQTILVIASVITVTLASIGVLVYFRKRKR